VAAETYAAAVTMEAFAATPAEESSLASDALENALEKVLAFQEAVERQEAIVSETRTTVGEALGSIIEMLLQDAIDRGDDLRRQQILDLQALFEEAYPAQP